VPRDARQHAHQRRLSAAVRADERNPLRAGDLRAERREQHALTICALHAVHPHHHPAAAPAGRELQPHRLLVAPHRGHALHPVEERAAALGLLGSRASDELLDECLGAGDMRLLLLEVLALQLAPGLALVQEALVSARVRVRRLFLDVKDVIG
jgi:hypothetical protein